MLHQNTAATSALSFKTITQNGTMTTLNQWVDSLVTKFTNSAYALEHEVKYGTVNELQEFAKLTYSDVPQEFMDSIDKVCSKRSKEEVYDNSVIRKCTVSGHKGSEYRPTGNPPKKLLSVTEVKRERHFQLTNAKQKLVSLVTLLEKVDEGTKFESGFLPSYVYDAIAELTKIEAALGRDNLLA